MKIAVFGDSISTHIEMEVMTQAQLTEAGIAAQVARFAVAGEDTNAAMNRLAGVVASKADYYYIFLVQMTQQFTDRYRQVSLLIT